MKRYIILLTTFCINITLHNLLMASTFDITTLANRYNYNLINTAVLIEKWKSNWLERLSTQPIIKTSVISSMHRSHPETKEVKTKTINIINLINEFPAISRIKFDQLIAQTILKTMSGADKKIPEFQHIDTIEIPEFIAETNSNPKSMQRTGKIFASFLEKNPTIKKIDIAMCPLSHIDSGADNIRNVFRKSFLQTIFNNKSTLTTLKCRGSVDAEECNLHFNNVENIELHHIIFTASSLKKFFENFLTKEKIVSHLVSLQMNRCKVSTNTGPISLFDESLPDSETFKCNIINILRNNASTLENFIIPKLTSDMIPNIFPMLSDSESKITRCGEFFITNRHDIEVIRGILNFRQDFNDVKRHPIEVINLYINPEIPQVPPYLRDDTIKQTLKTFINQSIVPLIQQYPEVHFNIETSYRDRSPEIWKEFDEWDSYNAKKRTTLEELLLPFEDTEEAITNA